SPPPPPPSTGGPGIIESVVVDRGVIFCNPVEKTDSGGVVTTITNPNSHLKMYRFHPNIPNQKALTITNQFGGQNVTISAPVLLERTTAPVSTTRVQTNNQFGPEKFFVTQAQYLCVPTLKQTVSGP